MEGKKKFQLTTTNQVLIAVVLAFIAGLIFKEKMTVLQPIGNIFLNLIKSLVIPLIFFSICGAVSNMEDMAKLKSIGGKALLMFMSTTAVAAAIGIVVSQVMQIGKGMTYTAELAEDAGEVPGILEIILNMFPSNIIKSMADSENIQVIIFAILLGCAIIMAGDKAAPLKRGIDSITEVLYSLTQIIMKFSPIGIFCLLGPAVGENGAEIFSAIGMYILAVYISCFVMMLVNMVLVKTLGHMSLKKFAKAAWNVGIVAFTTRSSSGTLPITMDNVRNGLGVSEDVADFVLPLGATVNMNGAALNMTAFAVLAANVCGVHLTLSQLVITIFICTILGVGSTGIPSGGLVLNLIVLSTLGLPEGLLALITGIDNLTDMICTATNVVGDMVSSVIINRSEEKRIRKTAEQ